MEIEKVLCPPRARQRRDGVSYEARMFVALMRFEGVEFELRDGGVLLTPGDRVTPAQRHVMEEVFYEVHELLVAEKERPN